MDDSNKNYNDNIHRLVVRDVWHSELPPHIDDEADAHTPNGRMLKQRVLDYPCTPKDSFVVSGPMGESEGRGRYFPSPNEALMWAQEKYGAARVKLLDSSLFNNKKWAIRVYRERP